MDTQFSGWRGDFIKDTKEKVKVMQGFIDGKEVERRNVSARNGWTDTLYPVWDWITFTYRIKEK